MSKLLTFKDGSTLEVCDSSTIYDVIVIFPTSYDMIKAWDLFTKENLSHGTIGDMEFSDIVPLDLNLVKDEGGLIIGRFESRDKTEMELIKEELHKYYYVN